VYRGETSVLAIGQKVKSPEPYRVDFSVEYPAPLTQEALGKISDMCQKAIGLLGIEHGVAHVEFAYTQDGPKLFEIGARCGGGHTPLIAKQVSGVNEFIEYCRISCGSAPENMRAQFQKGAAYRFLIFPEGEVTGIEIPEHLTGSDSVIDFILTVKKGDHIGAVKTTKDRLGCVVTKGETLEDAVAVADEICRQLKIRYSSGMELNGLVNEG
jgi:biotin carboxylase